MTLLLLAFIVLVAGMAQAQVYCTPLGTSTYCAGWDAQMTDRAFTVAPLGTGSIIVESKPQPSVTRQAAPMAPAPIAPLVPPTRRAAPGSTSLSPSLKAGLDALLEDRKPMKDDLLEELLLAP